MSDEQDREKLLPRYDYRGAVLPGWRRARVDEVLPHDFAPNPLVPWLDTRSESAVAFRVYCVVLDPEGAGSGVLVHAGA